MNTINRIHRSYIIVLRLIVLDVCAIIAVFAGGAWG